MSGHNTMISDLYTLENGLHGRNFCHPEAGFGSIEEGYAESDACTVVKFPDLGGVSRTDVELVEVTSEEMAREILDRAVKVVLPHVS